MTTIADIAALIERFTGTDGAHQTAIRSLQLSRRTCPGEPMRGVHEPSFCLIAQGTKRVMLADEIYLYDRSRFLVASVDLPVSGQVIQASEEEPYLGFVLRLDPAEVAEMAAQARLAPPADAATVRGLFVAEPGAQLLEAIERLVRLLDAPADIPALAPLAQREVLYRLLRGEHGWRIAQMVAVQGHSQRVRNAIGWLRSHFADPLHVDHLARQVNMSPSSLHHHFKAVYRDEPAAVPEAAAPAGGAPPAAERGARCGYGGASGRLRERLAVQPRVQPPLRGAAGTRPQAVARSTRRGDRRCVGNTLDRVGGYRVF